MTCTLITSLKSIGISINQKQLVIRIFQSSSLGEPYCIYIKKKSFSNRTFLPCGFWTWDILL